jgi:anaphase-promoting complex subunit 2
VYAERFRHLKAPRKLLWRPALGLVELAVTVGDSQPLNFRVTPIHAALLLQFADDSPAADSPAAAAATAGSSASVGATDQGLCLSAGQLAAALGIPTSVVRQKAIFWVAAGVLLERRGSSGDVEYKRATSIDPSRIGG